MFIPEREGGKVSTSVPLARLSKSTNESSLRFHLCCHGDEN